MSTFIPFGHNLCAILYGKQDDVPKSFGLGLRGISPITKESMVRKKGGGDGLRCELVKVFDGLYCFLLKDMVILRKYGFSDLVSPLVHDVIKNDRDISEQIKRLWNNSSAYRGYDDLFSKVFEFDGSHENFVACLFCIGDKDEIQKLKLRIETQLELPLKKERD